MKALVWLGLFLTFSAWAQQSGVQNYRARLAATLETTKSTQIACAVGDTTEYFSVFPVDVIYKSYRYLRVVPTGTAYEVWGSRDERWIEGFESREPQQSELTFLAACSALRVR